MRITRRSLVTAALPLAAAEPALEIPLVLIVDTRSGAPPPRLARFRERVWPEAVAGFARCGIRFRVTEKFAPVRRTPSDHPLFEGLERGALNLVLTARVPLRWDNGRGLAGVTTLHEGFHLCVVALDEMHGHQAPFLSVNTCVHELLHALLGDIFAPRPPGAAGLAREARIDAYATRLWLFGDGAAIRKAAEQYAARAGFR